MRDKNVTDSFNFVPMEVILYIFAFSDVPDLLTLCAVSQRMKQLAGNDWLWKPFILNSSTNYYFLNKESKHGTKPNQSCMTFFCTQQKLSKMNELFNKVREEELRFQYLSHSFFEKKYGTFVTPLLLSYAFYLNVNPIAYTELNVPFKLDQDLVANHLLKKLPVIYHSNVLILREMYRFVSLVYPSSKAPSAYIASIATTNARRDFPHLGHDFPLLYLYITFKKLAEHNPYEIIFYKDPSFFRELNDFLAHNGLQGNKLMIFSETLIAHPEMLYAHKILTVLKDILNYLKNTDVTSNELFDYYHNSLYVRIGRSP